MTAAVSNIGKVIAAGQQSRIGLAAELAEQFQRDPRRFDARRLERLGTAGLRQFLGKIGDGSSPPPKRSAASRSSPNAPGITSSRMGWAALRRPERSIWIGGVAAGLRAGAIVIAFGLIVVVSVEQIIPVVREMLS
ncbi:MAG: hypothetical protein AB7V13_08280 [Pseudorhodoplanes sp.]